MTTAARFDIFAPEMSTPQKPPTSIPDNGVEQAAGARSNLTIYTPKGLKKKKGEGVKEPPRWKRFADEYMVDMNATAAYKRAGYKSDNDRAVWASASQLLRRPKVQLYLVKRREELRRRTEITQEKVVEELAKVGFANMQDYLTFEKRVVVFKDSKDLSREQMAAIAEVSSVVTRNADGTVKSTLRFKLHDKGEHLRMLGEHLGIFDEKMDLGRKVRKVLIIEHNGSAKSA